MYGVCNLQLIHIQLQFAYPRPCLALPCPVLRSVLPCTPCLECCLCSPPPPALSLTHSLTLTSAILPSPVHIQNPSFILHRVVYLLVPLSNSFKVRYLPRFRVSGTGRHLALSWHQLVGCFLTKISQTTLGPLPQQPFNNNLQSLNPPTPSLIHPIMDYENDTRNYEGKMTLVLHITVPSSLNSPSLR